MAIILPPDVARKVMRPGPQPCNRIPATLADALRLVQRPRPRGPRPNTDPATMADVRRLAARVRDIEQRLAGVC